LKKILKILKSQDGKSLLRNFVSQSAINLVVLIIPFFTLPYLLRVIGIEKFGLIALATSLISYFITIVDYSFNITATRDVAKHQHSYNQLCLIYSKVITAKLFFVIVSFLTITLIVILINRFNTDWQIYMIISLQLISNLLFPQWFFQGIEDVKYLAIIKVSLQVLLAFSIFIFIKHESDFLLYAFMLTFASILSGVFGQIILLWKYKIKYKYISYNRFKSTLKSNFPIFVNQFFPMLYNNTSTFLLAFFVTNEMVGIYAALKRVVDMSITLLKTFSNVFFPFLNRRHDAFIKYKTLILSATLLMIILMIALNQKVFLFLNINWPNAFWLLTLLSLSIIGYVLYDIYGLNFLIVKRHDVAVMKNTIIMSITGFIIAFPLIYFLEILGAGLTMLITRMLLGMGVYYLYRRTKNNSYE
jgi:PST family polysaccharide transporter